MLSLFANAFRVATRTEESPPRTWDAPPHWQLPVRDLPGRERV